MFAVLVMGATGVVGSLIVERLLARGVPVKAASREPDAVRARWPGAAATWLDLERPASFAAALVGVDRVFMIARPGDDAPDVVAAPLIAAMAGAGVAHVVNLTALGVERADHAPGLRRVETLLEASGLAWTHLRPNFFAQLFVAGPLRDALRARGTLAVPAADARISFIDAADIADVAVAALTDPRHRGHAYELTGPAALDHAEVAAILGAAAGRPFRYLALDEARATAMLAATGFSQARIDRLVRFYRLVRSGLAAPVSDDVARVLGRPASALKVVAERHADAWRPAHDTNSEVVIHA